MAYPRVNRSEANDLIGDGLEVNIPVAEMGKELRKRYHVFYLLPKGASYGGDATILKFWRGLPGQNVLELEDSEAVCEIIALAIGMMEGTIGLRAGIDDLRDCKTDEQTLRTVSKALANLPASLMTVRASGNALPGLDAAGSSPHPTAKRSGLIQPLHLLGADDQIENRQILFHLFGRAGRKNRQN